MLWEFNDDHHSPHPHPRILVLVNKDMASPPVDWQNCLHTPRCWPFGIPAFQQSTSSESTVDDLSLGFLESEVTAVTAKPEVPGRLKCQTESVSIGIGGNPRI